MKVLIVNDFGTPSGGAEHMSLMLRDRLRERGHEARLFTSRARAIDTLPVLADVTCFGTTSPLQHFLQIANPHAVLQLRRVLESFRPEIVHVRMFHTQLSPLILPLLRRFRSVLHVVNYNLICPRNTKILPDGSRCAQRAGSGCRAAGCVQWRGVARFVLQRRLTDLTVFDAVVANSLATQRRLEADGMRVDEYIWNGVPRRTARPALEEPPVIGFAGRFFAKKGIDVLVRAMAHVLRELPQAKLLLVGDGPERPRIAALISELRIGANVELTGFRSRAEAEELLERAWVQVVPSVWEEPFGLVAAEAMMRGTAGIVSDAGGLAEQIRDGETGYCVPPGDPEALAQAIVRLARDRRLAERLGAAGRVWALAQFTEERVVDRFETLYRRLLERKTPFPRPALASEP